MRVIKDILAIIVATVITISLILVLTLSNQNSYFKSDFVSQMMDVDIVDDALLWMMGTEIPTLNTYLKDKQMETPDLSLVLFKLTTGITPSNFPSLMEAELPGLKSYALGINFSNQANDSDTSSDQSSPLDLEKDKRKSNNQRGERNEGENEKESKNNSDEQSENKPLAGYHVVLDPGHGGKDTGTIGTEIYEKTLTLSTAKKVEQQLKDKGASVTLTRTDDTFIPLAKRAQISNTTDTDAFISLHYNASEDHAVRGISTFYYDGDENRRLADTIQQSLMNRINLKDRGKEQANYQVLTDNEQLAVLIELGFVTNPEEQKLIQTDRYQKEAAKSIVVGLENYFNEGK